ncbi:hypothetical protein GPJ56_002848 [Histomonas meleagridis]|uniref:uncharacterized protein n=1 Tax=Histomonas meleagridis TaxID=135588 RepID=UPI0035595738|nr:hypothetical protein GPJ56_002848 [Histomonas meleagridis]KAH0806365.1 hypothetical protein GO595_001053 [Histomonas meleagridis]
MQCSDRVLQNGKIVQFKPNPICFQNILTKAAGKPVVFVTLCGSYQSGKSSTIKMLTGNCDIVIGNAMDEQTHGAYVYGPISYNFLRKRFHMKELPGDETQVFFVDTEGSSGFEAGEANEEANRYLLSQLIAPYAALSNVVTTIVRSAISTNEVETMKLILDIVKTVRQGTDLKNRSCLLALVPQTKDYDPTSGQFEDIQQRVTENVVKKFGSDFDITEVIPLSAYNINADILEQSPEFNAGFRIFAQHLINHIEETRKQVPIEAEGAVLIFKKLIEITDKQNLSEIAIDAMNDAKRHSFDKLYSPIADEVINNQISSIQKIIEELTNEIQNKEFVEAYQIDTTKICNEAYKELDEKLPPD